MSDGIEIKIKSYFNVVQPAAHARIDYDADARRLAFVARAKFLADALGAPHGTEAHLHEIDPLIEEFYALPGNGSGGTLHIVLDDDNTEEEHVEWCREEARKAGDEPAFWMAQVLLALTEEERRRVCVGDDEDDLLHAARALHPGPRRPPRLLRWRAPPRVGPAAGVL